MRPRPRRAGRTAAFVLAALCLVAPGGLRAADPPASLFGGLSPNTGLLLKDDVVISLINESSGDLARDTVQRLSLWDRSQVTLTAGHFALIGQSIESQVTRGLFSGLWTAVLPRNWKPA